MFADAPTALPQISGGKLRALAVSSAERSAVLPQVPTLNESGLKGFESTAWWALFAPAGLPSSIAAKLTVDARRIVEMPGFRDRLLEIGVRTPSGRSASFAEFQRAEIAKWAKVVHDAGVTLE